MPSSPLILPPAVRAVLATAGLLFVVACVVGLLWYLSYGTNGPPPGEAHVEGLAASVSVHWHDAPLIEQAGEKDFYAALGYIHAQRHGWSAALWRQTALGTLSEWFGDDLHQLDLHTRHLGFSTLARETFDDLPEGERQFLEAYVNGLNAAYSERSVRMSDEFSLLRIEPELWEPWHPLAVERLLAWLSTPALSLEDAPGIRETLPVRTSIMVDSLHASPLFRTPPEPLERFLREDRMLRDWLHLYGFENSMAWAIPDGQNVHLYQRHTYGASALPLIQNVSWRQPGGAVVQAATVPGTLMMPGGRTPSHAWSILLHGTALFSWMQNDPETEFTRSTKRVHTSDGGEHATTIRRIHSSLILDDASGEVDSDSLLTVQWNGFEPTTDLGAWRALYNGTSHSFHLIRGDGLCVERDTSPTVLGQPAVATSLGNGMLVSNTPWAEYGARTIEELRAEEESIFMGDRIENRQSSWAEETASALVTSLDQHPFPSESVLEALTYLRNWNYTFDRSSIAATIFDHWAARFQESTHTIPTAELAEAPWSTREQAYRTLQETVDELRAAYGEDPSQWRWENTREQVHHYPVWSADTLLALRGEKGYAARVFPGDGHPSSPRWGPSALASNPFPAASWEGWAVLNGEDYDTFKVRQHDVRARGLRARILQSNQPPSAELLLPDSAPDYTTTLLPAN